MKTADLPNARFVEQVGDYEVWEVRRRIASAYKGIGRPPPSLTRTTRVTYAVSAYGRVVKDNLESRAKALAHIRTIEVVKRI